MTEYVTAAAFKCWKGHVTMKPVGKTGSIPCPQCALPHRLKARKEGRTPGPVPTADYEGPRRVSARAYQEMLKASSGKKPSGSLGTGYLDA